MNNEARAYIPPDPANVDACAVWYAYQARRVHRALTQGAPDDALSEGARGYMRAVLNIDRAYTGEIAALAAGHPDRLAVDAKTAPLYRAAYLDWRNE